MGGYAVYVWSSYGVTAAILLALLIIAWREARRREAEVDRLRAAGVDPRRRVMTGGTGETA